MQVFDRELTALEVAQLHDGKSASQVLTKPADQLSAQERDHLFDFYVATAVAAHDEALTKLAQARDARRKLMEGIKEIMVMKETTEPKADYILERGLYSERGEEVGPDVPAVLPPFPAGQPRNRASR